MGRFGGFCVEEYCLLYMKNLRNKKIYFLVKMRGLKYEIDE
jgi:hypothetical protein